MASTQIGIRVTLEESVAMNQAAEALGMLLAQLLEIGGVEGAHRMGIYDPKDVNVRRWRDAPKRDGSAREQVFTRIPPFHEALIGRAAALAGVSISNFMAGSTLRFISERKKHDRSSKALAAVQLPKQYEVS